MQPTRTDRVFEPGPTTSAPDVVEWMRAHALRADGKRRMLRIPVVASGGVLGSSYALAGAGEGALPLAIDDTALGISLADRRRQMCPSSDVCAFWVHGYVGDLLPRPDTDDHDGEFAFAVLEVGEVIESLDDEQLRVAVEAASQ